MALYSNIDTVNGNMHYIEFLTTENLTAWMMVSTLTFSIELFHQFRADCRTENIDTIINIRL